MRKTIIEIKECKDEAFVVVLATSKHVLEDADLWHTTCVCNKAIYPDSKIFFFCDKCNQHVVTIRPRLAF